MCLLVISNYFERLDPSRLLYSSVRINELVDAARVKNQPVAFLQGLNGASFDSIGVRIGRYEPIFTVCDVGRALPSGLIDFVVAHAASQIQLAGVAALNQFERCVHALHRSGYAAVIEAESVLFVDGDWGDKAKALRCLSQFMENDAFTLRPFAGAASMKNQSTRWPNA